MMKEKVINQMNIEFSEKETHYNIKLNETEKKLEYLSRENQYLIERNEKIESEMSEMLREL
jgi:hypothetical protein